MPEVNLTAEQRTAVESSSAMLVGAAAGSGKTFVLTERVARILNDRQKPVKASRMLILTFSNAAASEMRQKIRRKLSDMIAASPDDSYLREQQRQLRRAHIGTVHSFCQKLLREFFSEAGVSPDFTLCDDTYSATIRRNALEESFDRLCEEDPETAGILAGGFGRSRSAWEAMESVLAFHRFEENLADDERWEDKMLASSEQDVPFRDTPAAEVLADRLAFQFSQALELLDWSEQRLTAQGASGKGYMYLCDMRDHCAALCRLFSQRRWEEAASLIADKPEGKLTFQKSADDITRARASAGRKMYDDTRKKTQGILEQMDGAEEARASQRRIAAALIKAERYYRDSLKRIKTERNMLEYADLEQLVIRLFYDSEGRMTETAASVADRYDFVMVDEFQDTNERQKLIFDAVSSGGRTLFCVGDVKQSIYSFRRADPAIFTRMRDSAGQDGMTEYVALHSNFRSDRTVINAVNRIFDPLMTSAFGGVDYMPDERLAYGGAEDAPDDGGCGLEYHCVNCASDELPEAVAGYVSSLLRSGYTVHGSGGERPLREEDICILLRTMKGRAELYTEELGKAGIRSASTSSEDFFSASEIMVMMSLLRCVDNPGSDIDLAAVMLSPVGGFDADGLTRLKLAAGDGKLWNALRNSEDPKCVRLAEMISGLRTRSSSKSAEESVRDAVETSEAEVYLTSPPDTPARKTRIRALISFAADYTAYGGSGLSGFIRMCSEAAARGGGPEISGNSSGGVLITSVHKAKGLEWPVVILADAGRDMNTSADGSGNVLFEQNIGIAAKIRTESEDGVWMNKTPEYSVISDLRVDGVKAEEMRILYVALTRAKHKAVVFAASRDIKKGVPVAEELEEGWACVTDGTLPPSLVASKNNFSDWIALAYGAAGFSVSDLELGRAVRGDLELWRKEAAYYLSDAESTETGEKAADPELTEEIDRRLSFRYSGGDTARIPTRVTVTQLTESYRPALSHRPAFVREGGLTAAEKGTAMHEFMQHCDLAAAAEDPAAEAERLRELRFLTEQEAASINGSAVKEFFRGRIGKAILDADRLYREYSFMDSVPASVVIKDVEPQHANDTVIIQGTADCVIEKDGRLTILDYKTDRVNSPDELESRYTGQLRAYSRSVSARLGMPVTETVLWSFWLGCEVVIPPEEEV